MKNAQQLLIEGVTRTFPGARGKLPTQALLPIDFAVRENDFVTILGPGSRPAKAARVDRAARGARAGRRGTAWRGR